MNKQLFFFIVCFFCHYRIFSQSETDLSTQLEQKIEQNAGSGEDETDFTELTEVLTELLKHPLNINKSSIDDFRETGLFSENHIKNIILHREKFGSFLTVYELQVVQGMNEDYIRQIIPYISTGKEIDDPNASIGRMVREGKHQLILRAQLVPEKRKGFSAETSSSNYLGSPYSLYARYRFTFMKKISMGFVADKDAGEEFFKGSQKKGFDFYSGHFALRKIGLINLLVIGDYQLEYGQGLTLWTSLSGGKSADPAMIIRNAQGIRPYTSSNEAFFKRGIALSVKKRSITVDGFLSARKPDGNRTSVADTINSDETFTSIQESGYHRTESEIADKNAVKELSFGGHVGYSKGNFKTGFTMQHTSFNIPFIKNAAPYNRFDFSGRSLSNAGVDYSFLFRNINLFGETAVSDHGVFATVNGVVLSLDPKLTVSMLYRSYPRNFNSLSASAFRESGNNFNEQGIYCGFNFRPLRVLGITCNYDKFYFPWLRYRTDAPSGGYEFNMMVSYKPNRKSELYFRYRESSKMINGSELIGISTHLVPVFQRGFRIHLTTKVSKSFTLRTRLESVKFRQESRNEKGFMIFQDVQFHPMGFPVSFNFRYALFDTDSYDSRIYAYENDVLYGYSIPAYYYKGSRLYFNTRIKIRKGIDAWFRYAATFYSNRNVIGSGLDEIQGSKKSELKLQVRFEF